MGSDARDLVKHTKLFIDGRFVDAVSDKTFPTFNPSNSECIAQVAEGDAADVDLAVRVAREAFDPGPGHDLLLLILHKFADVIEEHLDELATLETLNNGMLIDLSKGIIAGWADKLNGKTLRTDSTRMCYTLLEPIGVVGAIVPWNFPAHMFLTKVGSALTCGNTIVVKVAEQTPLTGLLLASLSQEAGIPAGVLNVIPGYGPTAGAAISKHMSVGRVTFTGSTEVGRMIMESAARRNLKPVTLELGGKSPFIICEDAAAAAVSQNAIFMHQGQVCVAASRVFVHESIHDEFIKRSVKLASEREIGDPFQSKDFTSSQQFLETSRSIKSGVVYVNSYLGYGPAVPFGGYKMSGIGRENGYEGLLPYLQHKNWFHFVYNDLNEELCKLEPKRHTGIFFVKYSRITALHNEFLSVNSDRKEASFILRKYRVVSESERIRRTSGVDLVQSLAKLSTAPMRITWQAQMARMPLSVDEVGISQTIAHHKIQVEVLQGDSLAGCQEARAHGKVVEPPWLPLH
ncbi:hypothetical protein SELMODRAFT_446800 [Selaginella moellendorffii]|uniref:Aldehyde dehydrogenase domain-containing protein n=1 Tax=Selaginella moellendorffii TaxID=88036 RepID=D8SUF5_SELML|nr:hypothetical protein SELMODRAFT_446800 [Selaginella moellendorffii]